MPVFRNLPVAVLLAGLLGGCSLMPSMDSLNPFASKGPRMAELTPIQASAELRQVWSYQIGKADLAVFHPAVAGSSVYVAAADGSIARLDQGQPVWRINAGKALSAGVGSDGVTVVVGTAEGEVLAFAARDGAPLWQARVSSEVLAPPLVAGDLVVVRSGDNRVVAFDGQGKRKWLYQRPTPTLFLRSTAPMVLADQFVLAGFPGGKLVALAAHNGAPVWEGIVATPKGATELDRVADVVAAPVTRGPLGCAVAFQGRVTCFDFSQGGNTLWSRELSSAAGLALDPRAVYVSDDDGNLHALALDTGASLWKQERLQHRRLSAPLVLGSNRLVIGDVQGVVHLINRDDGDFAARFTTDGSPIAAPPQLLGGQILVQTRQGNVYALEVQ
ncbi:outer membrane protein assembly factor BamB [Azovibrio restrictus]|uniref:outer membrane protein assembly factor BamB n=1 Tax=Azovibrio restrictus TaxID=146938 RepID=UPI0026EA8EEE|nr:outer membrane protein assembly factor BamB [Azovibrio restrictus]